MGGKTKKKCGLKFLIVKDVGASAVGNQNGGIWWVLKQTLDKIQAFSSKFVDF